MESKLEASPNAVVPIEAENGNPIEILGSLRLPSALHTIAFSTAVAALAGLSALIGNASANGQRDALGLYALSLPPLDEKDIYLGVFILAEIAVQMALVAIVVRLSYLVLKLAFSKIPRLKREGLIRSTQRWSSWVGLLVATIIAFGLFHQQVLLMKQVRGLLFRNLSSLGQPWTQFIFEPEYETASGYGMAFAALLVIFIGCCWWFTADKSQSAWRKTVVTLLAAFFLVFSIGGYAYLQGAVMTVDDYPVVSFSGQLEMFGEHSIPILIGQDDKMFALLVVLPGAGPNEVHKMVVYLPRTEVKYMAVLLTAPLYQLDKYDDLQKIERQIQSKQ